MFVHDVCRSLAARDVRYALVGGYAVALHGAVRGTIDIDIVIRWQRDSLRRAELAMGDCGLVSRLPVGADDVFAFRDEYIEKRNLIAWNFFDGESGARQVDLLINYDLTRKRTKRVHTEEGALHILNLEDLIAMKKDSGRPQDLLDVEALEKLR